jgi:hypothetical protein
MSGRLGICTSTSARRTSDDSHDCAGRVGGQGCMDVFEMRFVSVNVLRMPYA